MKKLCNVGTKKNINIGISNLIEKSRNTFESPFFMLKYFAIAFCFSMCKNKLSDKLFQSFHFDLLQKITISTCKLIVNLNFHPRSAISSISISTHKCVVCQKKSDFIWRNRWVHCYYYTAECPDERKKNKCEHKQKVKTNRVTYKRKGN